MLPLQRRRFTPNAESRGGSKLLRRASSVVTVSTV